MSTTATVIDEAVKWGVPVVLTALAGWWAVRRNDFREWRQRRREKIAERDAIPARLNELLDQKSRTTQQFQQLSGQVTGVAARMTEQDNMLAEMKSVIGSVAAMSLAHFQRSKVAMFVCDNNGFNLDVNDTYAKIMGVSREDLLGYGYRSRLVMDGAARYLAAFNAAASEHRTFEGSVTVRRPDGVEIRIHVQAVPHPKEHGPATHWVGTVEETANE